MPKPTKEQKILAEIHKHVDAKTWKCIIDGCNEQSINSHLLQQNGILDNVSVDGHLIECKEIDIFTWTEDTAPFYMKRLGKNKAFSLPLFCNNHDSSIFKEIETHPITLSSYRVQLLLSYRVVCAEIRKKEINVELFRRVLNAESLKVLGPLKEIRFALEGNELGINDLKRFKAQFEKELEKGKSNFTFRFYKYPFLEIYGSAVFSPIDYLIIDPKQVEPLNNVFIHIIPYDDNLNIVVGYNNNYVDNWIKDYVDSWNNLEEEEFERKLTNLFAAHIENWGMSPDLHVELKKENIKLLIDYKAKNALNLSSNQMIDFNLFE